MKLSRAFLVLGFFISSLSLLAQDKFPQGYFLFPIQPGSQNFLAGNMGELRATHFHAGIDIKTAAKEGFSVYAAADGYVSRIKVSTSGYGNALYLTHPNGLTTVYAHLLSFSKPLARYVMEQQYRQESFEIEICPQKNQFNFRQGEVIGLSGNSGSSGGPHLHFEIRDSLENFLDPLLFRFKEIVDNIPPVIERIAIKTLDINSRVNGEFGRLEFKPELVGKDYRIDDLITAKGYLGIEILSHDKADQVNNKYGISTIEMKVDGESVFLNKIDKMPFEASRKILIHTDFENALKTGKRYQKLYVDDGNDIQVYRTKNRGKLTLNDSSTHQVEITLWDAYQNTRKLSFRIKGKQDLQFNIPTKAGVSTVPYYSLQENVMKIICKEDANNRGILAKIFSGYKTFELNPAYKIGPTYIYLWDLRSGLPDSAGLCSQTLQFGFSGLIPPVKEFNYYGRFTDLRFPGGSLFDTLYLDVKKIDKIFKIQSPYIPLYDNIFVTLKPDIIPVNKAKTAVYSINSGNSHVFEGGEWNNDGSITFKTKYFNYYVLATDSIPPTIKLSSKSTDAVRFIIADNLSGINDFRATINGQWLLMNYDHKRKLLWSSQLDNTTPLKGDFQLVVTDNAGNKEVMSIKL